MGFNKLFEHVKNILSRNICMTSMKIYGLQHHEYVQNTNMNLEMTRKRKYVQYAAIS